MSLSEERRGALRERIRSNLPIAKDGSIPLMARAWAVRGRLMSHRLSILGNSLNKSFSAMFFHLNRDWNQVFQFRAARGRWKSARLPAPVQNIQAAVFHLWTLTADISLRIELANR